MFLPDRDWAFLSAARQRTGIPFCSQAEIGIPSCSQIEVKHSFMQPDRTCLPAARQRPHLPAARQSLSAPSCSQTDLGHVFLQQDRVCIFLCAASGWSNFPFCRQTEVGLFFLQTDRDLVFLSAARRMPDLHSSSQEEPFFLQPDRSRTFLSAAVQAFLSREIPSCSQMF